MCRGEARPKSLQKPWYGGGGGSRLFSSQGSPGLRFETRLRDAGLGVYGLGLRSGLVQRVPPDVVT